MLCVSISFHHSVSVCVLHLNCVYTIASSTKVHPIHVIYRSPSHSFHLPISLSFISSTIVHHSHIYHIWSCSCYIVIHLLSRYIKKHDFCLNIFIHELISRLTHHSLNSRTQQKAKKKLVRYQNHVPIG